MFQKKPVFRTLLLGYFLFCTLLPISGKCEEPYFALFTNSWEEIKLVTLAPLQGNWNDYMIAAGFAGGLAASLNNDRYLFEKIRSCHTEWEDRAMPSITWLGEGGVQVGGYFLLYLCGSDREKKLAVTATEGQIVVAVVSSLIKSGFTATRPDHNREWFTGRLGNNSFPSGHSMTIFCAASIVGEAYQIHWLTYPIAAIVSYSRIYNQNHWPTDVIAGAGLGLLIGQSVVFFHKTSDSQLLPAISIRTIENNPYCTISWEY